MCIGPFRPKAPKMLALPDLGASNQAAADQVGQLPTARDTKTASDVASVNYGTNKKQSGPAAGNKTGTAALKIDKQFNTGNTNEGSNTGGINV